MRVITAVLLFVPALLAAQPAATTVDFAPAVAAKIQREPWADARLAIDQFAVKLAAACREVPKKGRRSASEASG